VKISGTATLHASRADVWEALNDPAVLVATIPGCERLEAVGEDVYAMTVSAGVGSIKGTYQGEVRLGDKQHPDSFVLHASGAGAPGTLRAEVLVRLEDGDGASTALTYDADAVVGGMIGGVGQRMITGVAKKTAAEFFAAVDDALAPTAAEPDPGQPAGVGSGTPTSTPSPTAGAVYHPPRSAVGAAAGGGAASFRSGAVVGAAAALLGALVGGWLAGRRRT
jgi:carbon monoxide dehydrogenase subunit G